MNRFHVSWETPRRPAFSLVLSLTVMAMLLLLCIGVAALMAVELRVAGAAVSKSRARLNALAGARIALGEVQRLLGPDQRVSATAEILCDPKKEKPADSGYYNSPTGDLVTHPRWVGVWNSGRVVDQAVPGAATDEDTKVIQRTGDGYLMDSRFLPGRDWETDRANKSPASATKRLAGWLVSGNEGLPADSAATITPFTKFDKNRDTTLAGRGTLGENPFAENDESDGRGARTARVMIKDTDETAVGSYAYWVADEGVKARINLENRHASKQPNVAALNDGGYFNLVIPQRGNFTKIRSQQSDAVTPFGDYADWDMTRLTSIGEFGALGLLTKSGDWNAAVAQAHFFNDISFWSAGIRADVREGGLSRDLTAYLNQGDIRDRAGKPGTGITDTTSILAAPGMAKYGPRFKLLRNWYDAAPAGNADTQSALNPTAQSVIPAPAGQQIPELANSQNSATPAPILTAVDYAYRFAGVKNGAAYHGRFMMYPYLRLWNPYGVTLTVDELSVDWLNRMATNAHHNGLMHFVTRPIITYKIPGKTVFEPGQAIDFIPVAGQDFGAIASDVPISVEMKKGVPGTGSYYVDKARMVYSAESDLSSDALNNEIRYLWLLLSVNPASAYDESRPMDQYFLKVGGKTFRQLNMDTYGILKDNGWRDTQMAVGFVPSTFQEVTTAAGAPPDANLHHGFRMMALDDTLAPVSSGAPAYGRNLNFNPFLSMNFLAPLQSRHPFDQAVRSRNDSYAGHGIFTTEHKLEFDSVELFSSAADNARPFLSEEVSGGKARFAIVDVPRKKVGVHSLAYLQNAPLTRPAWAPGMAAGNSQLPASDLPTNRSAFTAEEEDARWATLGTMMPFRDSASLNSSVRQSAAATPEKQLSLFDWSYELNHALWDGYWFSGIPAANTGWTRETWDFATTDSGIPDSKLVAAGASVAGPYFTDDNFRAYRAAYTLLQQGAFNVNSTSVPAWESLLAAFRGVKAPTIAGTSNDVNSTPYARLLRPYAAPVTSAGTTPSSASTWSGFRALSDDEIHTLAVKIVAEVKSRGPFLGLADFVNRRLKPIASGGATPSSTPYANWSDLENGYLGAIQASINAAQINKSLEPTDDPWGMHRDAAAIAITSPQTGRAADVTTTNVVPVNTVNPSHKPRSKIAGAPGYLMQADVLQQIGSALAARSDTFSIRATGEFEGASAYVELVVQRIPEPLIPDPQAATEPKSVASGRLKGNQLFGRRFQIVSLRWIASETI